MEKKIVLSAVALLLLSAWSLCVVGLLRLQIAYASPYTDIDVDTAYNMITNGSYSNLVVLDVRWQNEYDSGHIYGAVWIPYLELDARIGELTDYENHEIIVYCKSGYRSGIASDTLDSHNFTKVYNMLGGILAWQSAYYPVWIATVHNVNTTLNYDTIQAAIDAPQTLDGHTILVDAGTYYEHVVVDKSISLNGENRGTTVIDGNGTGNVINVTSHNVSVTGFTIQNGTNGILINTSNYNTISGNNLKNNSIGIHIVISPDNAIYHNNFINNTQQVYSDNSTNVWDNGYPSGGNYWSDYNGTDLYSGPYQNETGCECKPACDGIGDTPYVINGNNQDNYPLMHPRIIGDVNLDGTVNVMDMLALKTAIILGKTVEECPSCDVNCNGVVNIMDMLRLKIIITLA